MTILLHATGWDAEPWRAALLAKAPGRTIVTVADEQHFGNVRYALVWKPPVGLLARLPKLEVIVNLGAGVDAILADPQLPAGIPIIRAMDPDLTSRMTEWVVLQVLLHHRQMPAYLAQQHLRNWQPLPQRAANGFAVGLMGMGVLGQAAATALKSLGFAVAGWSRSGHSKPAFAQVPVFHGQDGLGEFLARTHCLVCLLPLTRATAGILTYDLFTGLDKSGLSSGPVLINAGRGGHQREADILRALDDGTLGGATLDVFQTEPLPADNPLWRHPKVIITPHVAADSDAQAMAGFVLAQLARHEAGLAMENLVDRAAGY